MLENNEIVVCKCKCVVVLLTSRKENLPQSIEAGVGGNDSIRLLTFFIQKSFSRNKCHHTTKKEFVIQK
jgi:hypothetical protein